MLRLQKVLLEVIRIGTTGTVGGEFGFDLIHRERK
jgi:hypothetical protein